MPFEISIPPLVEREEIIHFGHNFAELFHGEFSDTIQSIPIIDTIAPPCPKNLRIVVNTQKNRMLLMWYYPIHAGIPTIQNDIKQFDIYMVKKNGFEFEYSKIHSTPYPLYVYQPDSEESINSMYDGLMFCIKAIDYHNLESPYSEIVFASLNEDYNCTHQELSTKVVARNCLDSRDNKRKLYNKMLVSGEIKLTCGNFIGFLDSYTSGQFVFDMIITDLQTGIKYQKSLIVEHKSINDSGPRIGGGLSGITL